MLQSALTIALFDMLEENIFEQSIEIAVLVGSWGR
jgi:hypothetical protein